MIITKYKIRAFSFVEITIVCFIMVVLLIPIFTLMSRGSTGTVRNRNEILAQQYASNVIAYCNALPFNSEILATENGKKTTTIASLTIKDIPGHENIEIMLPVELGENASKTLTIVDFNKNDTLPNNYKVITVNVAWLQAGETKPRKVTMTGLVKE